jgi:hypothetical protein
VSSSSVRSCCCLILVDKPLTIESSAGAGATVIEHGITELTVALNAPGIVFGARGKGFTIRGTFGISVDGARSTVAILVGNENVTVRRNVLASHEGAAVIVGGIFQETEPTGAVITSNNFADNGLVAQPGLGSNCAVINRSANDVSAERNYWGSALGPGNDPADRACTAGGAVDTGPHLTRPVVIINSAAQERRRRRRASCMASTR